MNYNCLFQILQTERKYFKNMDMEQCKCGYVKILCPFHGANRQDGLKKIFESTVASIDEEIELLRNRKYELIKKNSQYQ